MYSPPYDGLTELLGIATLKQFRRKGIGGALTAHMVELAFSTGVEAVVLRAADEHAGRVYRRVGFAPSGTMLGYRAPDP
jgi:ribosomal protein S18 acetylase RimI-like enzyme